MGLIVVPVIDVMNGLAVHAVRGERKKYKPLESLICRSTDPMEVASIFSRIGFSHIYVADLDAILCKTPSWNLYSKLKSVARHLMLDSGIRSYRECVKLLDLGIDYAVVGSETYESMEELKSILETYSDRVVVSVDLMNRQILSPIRSVRKLPVEEYLRILNGFGLRSAIVLELSRVGSGLGVDIDMIRGLTSLVDRLYVGGGVRSIEDIDVLRESGVYGVLIATALHKRWVEVEDLRIRGYL
ncbi:MAG: HisA/HisF-related TIM barrel protein [Candidatus Bathyarchaeia archaeon]